jgi:hypothetical protein
MSDFVCSAWLKRGCPHSFKFLVFITEAGLLDQIRIVEMIEGDENFSPIKDELSAKLGKPATFPTVEVAQGTYLSDSDELIKHFAAKHGVDVDSLQTLHFYNRGIFARNRQLRQENKAYREKYGELMG